MFGCRNIRWLIVSRCTFTLICAPRRVSAAEAAPVRRARVSCRVCGQKPEAHAGAYRRAPGYVLDSNLLAGGHVALEESHSEGTALDMRQLRGWPCVPRESAEAAPRSCTIHTHPLVARSRRQVFRWLHHCGLARRRSRAALLCSTPARLTTWECAPRRRWRRPARARLTKHFLIVARTRRRRLLVFDSTRASPRLGSACRSVRPCGSQRTCVVEEGREPCLWRVGGATPTCPRRICCPSSLDQPQRGGQRLAPRVFAALRSCWCVPLRARGVTPRGNAHAPPTRPCWRDLRGTNGRVHAPAP